MLIESLDAGSVKVGSRRYRFRENEAGARVAKVDAADVVRLLREPARFRPYTGAKHVVAQEGFLREELPAGAPKNVADMNRAQLLAYAANLGMRRPDPEITDGKLRVNIIMFLEARYDSLMDDEPEDEPEADE